MRANKSTIIQWIKMTQVKNCVRKHNCDCADNYRKILLKRPVDKYDEKNTNFMIHTQRIKYEKCYHNQ